MPQLGHDDSSSSSSSESKAAEINVKPPDPSPIPQEPQGNREPVQSDWSEENDEEWSSDDLMIPPTLPLRKEVKEGK
jgi:hypothetical protein